MKKAEYTFQDVLIAGYTLEPLRCLNPSCKHVGEVVVSKSPYDARCQICGEWQLKYLEEEIK